MVFCPLMDLHPTESETHSDVLLLTVPQVARRLNISEGFVHKLKRHDRLTPIKLGRATRYHIDEVDRIAADGVSF
jgi:excisionase family DNA binding protein